MKGRRSPHELRRGRVPVTRPQRPAHLFDRHGQSTMRALICPTAFKGSLGAAEAARAMEEGVRRALSGTDCRRLPLSDGGPGLIESLTDAGDAGVVEAEEVSGPLSAADAGKPGGGGGPVSGRILLLDDGRTAVVESADACGLGLLSPDVRDPLRTDTRGVGELILAAMERTPTTVIVGLGGSATSDGGVGAARAFGYRFLDEASGELPGGGGALAGLAEIRRPVGAPGDDGAPAVPELVALADVNNPLLGPEGAAATYAPQKGAGPEDVERLEEGLRRLVEVAARDLEADPVHVRTAAERPGAGAAGGLAFGLEVFLGARVVGGTSWVLRRVGFDAELEDADLVITGEGAYDRTTGRGKVVGEVLRRAREAGVPVRLVCGRIEGELPENVRGEDGRGSVLDADGVAAAAERAARGAREGSSGPGG